MNVSMLHGVVTPGGFYSQVMDGSPENAVQALVGVPAGHTQPLFQGATQIENTVRFRTTQLATLLGECGLFGANLSAGNVDLYYRKIENLGTRASGNVHTRYRMASNAMMSWDGISVNQGQPADARVSLHPTYDGSNAPLICTGSVATAGTPTAAEYYGLGPVSINGSAITGVQGWSLALSPTVEKIRDNGAVWPTCVYVLGIAPQIEITTTDVALWNTYGTTGTAVTSFTAALRRYRNYQAGGLVYYADNTSNHITITGTLAVVTPQSIAGDRGLIKLLLRFAAADASSDAVTISRNVALV